MIHELAAAVALWIDRHGGRQPSKIRLGQVLVKALDNEAKDFPYWRENPKSDGKTYLLGIEVVEDEKVAIGIIDP